jgi:hypothetical protein
VPFQCQLSTVDLIAAEVRRHPPASQLAGRASMYDARPAHSPAATALNDT